MKLSRKHLEGILISLVLGLATPVYGQPEVILQNINNTSTYDTNRTDNPWWYYFPSLMVNCAGDMVAGFSGSATTKYVSTFATWRLANGVMLGQPAIIQPGTTTSGATNIVTRWGDYSTTTLDPTDDWSFWTVQEFAEPYVTNTQTNNQWGTVIARIRPNP